MVVGAIVVPWKGSAQYVREHNGGVVRCSSAVRNAIEHDMQVNSGLSSCAAVCVSVIRDSHQGSMYGKIEERK